MVVHAEQVETVVIGAGQAGLATAYHLSRRGRPCVVLEGSDRVGDVWRDRFDSLRLYTPARYDALPGLRFPGDPWSFPTKDEVADYLEAYVERHGLPVRTGSRVERVARVAAAGRRFDIRTVDEQHIEADNVVIASGTWSAPVTPSFATDLDPDIRQLHSAQYKNPSQLQPGPVLVVGASHSGADIAHEVAASHATVLAGVVRGEIPFDIEGRSARAVIPLLWFAANHVLTERTPIGRHARAEVRSHGGPLLRYKRADLIARGVQHHEQRVVGVEGGRPVLADGTVLDVRNVLWCTGFAEDTSWVEGAVTGNDGWPEQRQGRSPAVPGLYFVGLPFLTAFASMLVGGVHRDAGRVARQIDRSARRESVEAAASHA